MTTPNQARDALWRPLYVAPRSTITYPPESLLETAVFRALGNTLTVSEKRERVVLYGDFSLDDDGLGYPFWISVALSYGAREQRSMGPPGHRRFEVPGSMFIRPSIRLLVPKTFAEGLQTEESLPGLPGTAFIADAMFRDIVALYDGRRYSVEAPSKARVAGDNDEDYDVIVGSPAFRETGVEGSWYRAVIEVPFTYDQRA